MGLKKEPYLPESDRNELHAIISKDSQIGECHECAWL
jgi:hypothetical protein